VNVTVTEADIQMLAGQFAFPKWERGYEPAGNRWKPGSEQHLFVTVTVDRSSKVVAACDMLGLRSVSRDVQRRLRRPADRHCGICTIAAVEAGLV